MYVVLKVQNLNGSRLVIVFFIAITQCVIILEIASSSCETFISSFFVR